MVAYIWLALIVLGIVIEAASPQLVSIWFVFGAVAALVSSFFGVPIWVQVIIALAVSVISLIVTKPFVKKIMTKRITSTNADRYIGKEGVVTTEINDIMGTGRVTVLGSSWSAFSADGKVIPQHARVMVEEIQGVKLLVKPIE